MSDRKKAERERAMEAENRLGQKSTLSGAPEDRKFHQVEAFLLPNPLTGHREALIITASGSSGTRLSGETQKKQNSRSAPHMQRRSMISGKNRER